MSQMTTIKANIIEKKILIDESPEFAGEYGVRITMDVYFPQNNHYPKSDLVNVLPMGNVYFDIINITRG